jgi:hypothetical protein
MLRTNNISHFIIVNTTPARSLFPFTSSMVAYEGKFTSESKPALSCHLQQSSRFGLLTSHPLLYPIPHTLLSIFLLFQRYGHSD